MAAAAPPPNTLHPSGSQLEERIVGGSLAAAGEFPYLASVLTLTLDNVTYDMGCSASLYNAYTAVAAGHCVLNRAVWRINLRVGSLEWASGGKLINASDYIIHPDFYLYPDPSEKVDMDYSLIHLSEPADVASFAKFPKQGSDPADGTPAIIMGWGLTTESEKEAQKFLRKANVPIMSRAKCLAKYDAAPAPEGTGSIKESNVCAGSDAGGVNACFRDSGGPLVEAASGTVVGLVSWGIGCARAEYPGVYARVGSVMDWIDANAWTS